MRENLFSSFFEVDGWFTHGLFPCVCCDRSSEPLKRCLPTDTESRSNDLPRDPPCPGDRNDVLDMSVRCLINGFGKFDASDGVSFIERCGPESGGIGHQSDEPIECRSGIFCHA